MSLPLDRRKLSRVVAVANGKGGVGKTSLVSSLGGLAAQAGFRVLLVDLDPQGDVSDDLGLRGAGFSDEGQHLAVSLLTSQPLAPVVPDARPGLDVITGGVHLTDVMGAMFARHQAGRSRPTAFAEILADLAEGYDLVLVDTPPVDTQMQTLALSAARWLLIPTKSDSSSIRGLSSIADRVVEARETNPDLEVLGVILFDVASTAKRVRDDASEDIRAALGGVAPLFDQPIRSSQATAREARARGMLVHELAEKVQGAGPFWEALRRKKTERLPGAAPQLAADYITLVDSILTRMASAENEENSEVDIA